MKIIVTFIFCCLITAALAQNDGNGGGAVRISFGNEYVEPVSLSGNDPNIPPKPQREFHTNSPILNQILANCDDFSNLQSTLLNFQDNDKILLFEDIPQTKFFTIVYNLFDKNVVAVLDKGSGKRMNLLNNQFETDDIYPDAEFGKMRFVINE